MSPDENFALAAVLASFSLIIFVCCDVDYDQSVVLQVGGLSESEIDAKLEEAVKAGDTKLRSRESEPYILPAIVE